MDHRRAPTLADVLELIQQSIETAKNVREYQAECEAVSQRLVRLKDKLNGSNEQLRRELGTTMFEKIVHRLFCTLTKVRSLISECQNPNEALQGATKVIAMQALKTELDRVGFSLINYEADLTVDLKTKREILSSVLREKQLTDKNRQQAQIDERNRVLLNMIGTEATLMAQEKLPELYKNHKTIVDNYLSHCKDVHTSIPIVGLKASIGDFVTNIYQLSPSEFSDDVTSKIRTIELSVESVYIHLQADHSATFEREQARKLLLKNIEDDERDKDAYNREMWMGLASAPIMESLVERERVKKEKESDKSHFREILRNNRWIVILGDPGSGKTTFVRWLVSKYIKEIEKDTQTVHSDSSHQDRGRQRQNSTSSEDSNDEREDEEEKSNDESFVVGPPRMPILIRVGEYVEAVQRESDLSLIDYIGFHTWMGNPMLPFSSEQNQGEQQNQMKQLQITLHEYIKEGYALIILDGLDEIPDSETRSHVVRLVEEFAAKHVQTPSNISVFDHHFAGRELDIPYKAGGNQLIITTRIAGYHAQPLSGQFSHYTILPMKMDDTKQFVDYWFQTVHKKMISLLELSITDEKRDRVCADQTERLKKELEQSNNKGLHQMASNPCLMNFICLIAFRTRNAKLPTSRICLYDEMAKLMQQLWEAKELVGLAANIRIVDRLLCDIATYIHQNCSSGLIERSYLHMVCCKSLKPFIGSKSKSEQEKLADECIDQFQRSTGILVARGQRLYGFLHLTLQEYYTCKSIVNIEKSKDRSKKLVKVFQKHITDPRFRVPLTLALGWVSWKWDKTEFDEFCQALFTAKHHLSRYFPLEILMFITSIDELETLPSQDKILIGLSRLLSIAAKNNWHSNHPNLEKKMATSLVKLSRESIQDWIYEVVSSEKSTIETISTLCTLLQECERIAQSDENEEDKALLKNWANRDICKYLSKYLSDDTIENQFLIDTVLTKVAIKEPKSLPSNDLKTFFIENSTCLAKINLPLLAAIIALYGGLTLSYTKNRKQQNKLFDYDGNMVTSTDFAVVFSHESMHRKSPLTSLLIEYIRAQQSDNEADLQSDFASRIQKKAMEIQPNNQSLTAVDTFILMFCIVGVDEVWLYRPFIEHRAFHLAIDRFKRISNYLRQFYFIPEIYNKHGKSIGSKESLLSNFDNFNLYMYKKTTFNCDSTYLIDLFMHWHETIDKVHRQSSGKNVESLVIFIDSICRGRARLCTSTRTSLTNKWLCKSDQRFLLLPKFFQKQDNLKQLLTYAPTQSSLSNLSLPMFLCKLWIFNDDHHGADISEVTIKKAEYSMLFEYDRNHSFALTFVPKHLQLLFSRALHRGLIVVQRQYENQVVVGKSGNTLSFAHVLCTSILSVCNLPVAYACQSALVTLLPLARFYRLEHLILALLYWTQTMSEHDPEAVKWYFQEMKRPRDREQFSYTDDYNKLTDVVRVKISDDEVANNLQLFVEQATRRLRDALKLLRSRDSIGKENIEIFSASISLGYLCWSLKSGEEKSLFEEAIEAASQITDSLIRLYALNVLASCPFFYSSEHFLADHNEIQSRLHDSMKQAFSEMPLDLTPLLSVSFLDHYISLVGADDNIIERIDHILNQIDQLTDEDDRQAVCAALGPCMNLSPDISPKIFRFMQQFKIFSVLARAQVLQFDSPILRYFATNSTEHKTKTKTRYFLHDRDHSQSTSVLYASLYLANLSSDVQKLSTWLNGSQLLKVDISRLSNKQIDRSEKRILTYSHIIAIETKLCSLDDATQVSREVTALDTELYDFHQCEWSTRPFLMKWLRYKTDSPYYTLACHAALILGRSSVLTVDSANIICDLLQNDNDRLRQEAECLLHGNERKTKELGWDVLLIFIHRFISYETKSPYASLVLGWFFEKLTIDSTKHLDQIIELEQQRTDFHRKYKSNTEDSSTSREQQKLFESSSPIARWFFHLAPDVMEYFLTYLQSFINDLPAKRNRDRLKLTESHRLFVFGWCAKMLTVDSNNADIMLTMLLKIFTGNYSTYTQCTTAFAIGHCSKQEAQKILLDVVENRLETSVSISEQVLAMCIHAYCWSYASSKIRRSNDKQNNNDDDDNDEEESNEDDEKGKNQEDEKEIIDFCLEMLKHNSSRVQNAASIELAKFCHNTEKLLEYFGNDHGRCYESLIHVRIHQTDLKVMEMYSKCLVELIKNNSDVLRLYIFDLYKTIRNFGVQPEPYPEWSTEFSELFPVQIACDLIEEMPAAFFNEIDQMDDGDNLKTALFHASKQHDHRRRNACIKLLSSFGEFNVEVCDLLINALVENPSTQKTCFDAIKYFRKPRASVQHEKALQQLDQVLEQLEASLEELKSPLLELRQALREFQKAGHCLKNVLDQLKLISDQLKPDQEQVKSTLNQLESSLKELEPILKQWEPAFERLTKHLQSPSMIKRWGAALLFERLVQCNIVSARRVQNLLTKAIEDPTSVANVWLGKSDDTQSVYSYAGYLNQILCKLLMRMSSVDEASTEANASQFKNRLLEDFDVAQVSAKLASCINIDENPLDSDNEPEDSEDVDREKIKNIEIPRPSSQISIQRKNYPNRPLAEKRDSTSVNQRPESSKKPAEKCSVCNIM